MKPRIVSSVVALGVLAVAVPGLAQQTPDVMPTKDNNTQTQGGAGPTDQAAPAGTGTADPKKPAGSTGGYSYNDKPAANQPRGKYKQTGATVAMPGFEQTADGGSRFFVQLSQQVPVEERRAAGSITYVLKGASPRVWNNTNDLVTIFFSTPVSHARLVPSGGDLLLVLTMRASATPTYKMADNGQNGAQLSIDFPKGDWLNAPAVQQNNDAATAAPKPAAPRKKKK
jgi:hypothetical protein